MEDAPGAAPAREHLDLLGDPRAGRVDQVDHRDLKGERALLDAQDLLDRLRPPRAGLDRRVVGHQRHRPAVDRPHAGHHPVCAEPVLLPVRQQRLLGEAAVVEQQGEALPHRQLALLERLLTVALGPTRHGSLDRPLQRAGSGPGLTRAHRGSAPDAHMPGLSLMNGI